MKRRLEELEARASASWDSCDAGNGYETRAILADLIVVLRASELATPPAPPAAPVVFDPTDRDRWKERALEAEAKCQRLMTEAYEAGTRAPGGADDEDDGYTSVADTDLEAAAEQLKALEREVHYANKDCTRLARDLAARDTEIARLNEKIEDLEMCHESVCGEPCERPAQYFLCAPCLEKRDESRHHEQSTRIADLELSIRVRDTNIAALEAAIARMRPIVEAAVGWYEADADNMARFAVPKMCAAVRAYQAESSGQQESRPAASGGETDFPCARCDGKCWDPEAAPLKMLCRDCEGTGIWSPPATTPEASEAGVAEVVWVYHKGENGYHACNLREDMGMALCGIGLRPSARRAVPPVDPLECCTDCIDAAVAIAARVPK